MAGRRTFGGMRQLPNKRWQARYTDPVTRQPCTGPHTFTTKKEGEAWLTQLHNQSLVGVYVVQDADTTFAGWAGQWLARRRHALAAGQLKPRTVTEQARLLDRLILPVFGPVPLQRVTVAMVDTWWAALPLDTPTQNARAYEVLRMVFGDAIDRDMLGRNPCRIKGATSVTRQSETVLPTMAELTVILDTIAPRYRLMVALAAWCGLREGELWELRAADLHYTEAAPYLTVRAGVSWTTDGSHVLDPKAKASKRTVYLPPHLVPEIRRHLMLTGQRGRDLLFPSAKDASRPMRPSTLYKVWYRARHAAGRDDLRFHDLRHLAASLAAAQGAGVKEVMERLGQATPAMALHYTHGTEERHQAIACQLSQSVGMS